MNVKRKTQNAKLKRKAQNVLRFELKLYVLHFAL